MLRGRAQFDDWWKEFEGKKKDLMLECQNLGAVKFFNAVIQLKVISVKLFRYISTKRSFLVYPGR